MFVCYKKDPTTVIRNTGKSTEQISHEQEIIAHEKYQEEDVRTIVISERR